MKRLLLSAALALSLVACSVSAPQETPTPPPATSVVATHPEAYVTALASRVIVAPARHKAVAPANNKKTTAPPAKKERKAPAKKTPAVKPAPAAKKPVDQEALIRDCKWDAFRLCPAETAQAIAGNRGPITACMMKHKAQLSPACKAHG